MQPVSLTILKAAARIRATAKLKTPDAIHAATALSVNCAQFITNDNSFTKLGSLPVTVLKDII